MGYHFNILGWLAGWVLCQLFVLPRLLAGRAAQLAGKSQAPCKYGSKSSKTLCWPAGDLMIISSVQVCSIRSCGTWGAGGRFLKGGFQGAAQAVRPWHGSWHGGLRRSAAPSGRCRSRTRSSSHGIHLAESCVLCVPFVSAANRSQCSYQNGSPKGTCSHAGLKVSVRV